MPLPGTPAASSDWRTGHRDGLRSTAPASDDPLYRAGYGAGRVAAGAGFWGAASAWRGPLVLHAPLTCPACRFEVAAAPRCEVCGSELHVKAASAARFDASARPGPTGNGRRGLDLRSILRVHSQVQSAVRGLVVSCLDEPEIRVIVADAKQQVAAVKQARTLCGAGDDHTEEPDSEGTRGWHGKLDGVPVLVLTRRQAQVRSAPDDDPQYRRQLSNHAHLADHGIASRPPERRAS